MKNKGKDKIPKPEPIPIVLADLRMRLLESLAPRCFHTKDLKKVCNDMWSWLLVGVADSTQLIDERNVAIKQANDRANKFFGFICICIGLSTLLLVRLFS